MRIGAKNARLRERPRARRGSGAAGRWKSGRWIGARNVKVAQNATIAPNAKSAASVDATPVVKMTIAARASVAISRGGARRSKSGWTAGWRSARIVETIAARASALVRAEVVCVEKIVAVKECGAMGRGRTARVVDPRAAAARRSMARAAGAMYTVVSSCANAHSAAGLDLIVVDPVGRECVERSCGKVLDHADRAAT